ncbi:PAS and ANTAR domain-containing protein [Mycolicibacterium moriokaense]|uniref:PAS domain-containing protein n=1 Tax=Mycolicibacterium moriokaense TaxID=39691 RepID=A0A318H5A2_9MYCO|nr:PAS and ANTAR domain-containing protein [Mycolicibacterium moriokaense]PXW98876.1 PAS domain-containing protein [Mycolicibacterium moriokaense]
METQGDDDGPGPPPRPQSAGELHARAGEQPAVGAASPVEVALAGGSALRVGWFRFYFADQRWEWSTQVQEMHGYRPSVTPTTELVLAHKHPDDAVRVAATLEQIRQSDRTLSTRHRLIDVQGRVHDVIVIGERLADRGGAVIGTHGFYVDVTPLDEAGEEEVSAVVAEIAEHRAAIEQTKGMLMLIYRIAADTAFELLTWRSQATNVTLRALAQQLSADFLTLHYGETLPSRTTYERLLMTAHHRLIPTAVAASPSRAAASESPTRNLR